MRSEQTDQMGKSLTEDYRLSGLSPVEFFSQFEDRVGDIRVTDCPAFYSIPAHRETTAFVVMDGEIHTLYHHDDRDEIFVKL